MRVSMGRRRSRDRDRDRVKDNGKSMSSSSKTISTKSINSMKSTSMIPNRANSGRAKENNTQTHTAKTTRSHSSATNPPPKKQTPAIATTK